MASITIRNLPDETHRALKALAQRHGISTEAEVCRILRDAVQPPAPLGAALRRIGQAAGEVDLPDARDRRPHEPEVFG